MSRLDRHVNVIRTKLFLETLFATLAWALLGVAVIVLLAVVIDRRVVNWMPLIGRPDVWFYCLLGLAVIGAAGWAMYRRPTAKQAAVFIDDGLGLKEKFSTALYVRQLNDPFAAAAVRDAEATADNVSLQKRFPIRQPKHGVATVLVGMLAAVCVMWLGANPMFVRAEPPADKAQATVITPEQKEAQKLLTDALRAIDQAPPDIAKSEKIGLARQEIAQQLKAPSKSAEQQRRTALSTMQELDELKNQKIKDQQKFAAKQELFNRLQTINSVQLADNSPLEGLKDALGKGSAGDAAKEIEDVTKKFDQMKAEEKQKTADDMQKLAAHLKDQAKQPQQQMQQLANQLQQMGASQQQVQSMANLMQQAAAGNQQAQQQVQQAANQIAQQINNNPNLTPQQQKALTNQVNQIAQQMQGAASNQQQAQAMANAAQQLAQAMQQQSGNAQQQANAQQGQQGQPQGQQGQQQGQQANSGQQQGQGTQQGQQQGGQQGQTGQQAGQQQANAGQGSQPGQQGNQPGQQGGQGQQPGQGQGQGQQQSVADAGQSFAQQLEQMQQADGQQAQGQQPGQGQDEGTFPGAEGQDGQAQADGGGQNGGVGAFQEGDPQGQGQGAGGPGQAIGGRPKGTVAPFVVKPEQSPTKTNDKGELIASQFIKAVNEKGTSTAEAQKVIETAEKESAEEVEQDRISRQEASIVKKYFDDLKNDAKK